MLFSELLNLLNQRIKDYLQNLSQESLQELHSRVTANMKLYKIPKDLPVTSAIPSWCKCGKCREMKSKIEKVCCDEEECTTGTKDFKKWKEIHLDFIMLVVHTISDPHFHTQEYHRRKSYQQYTYWKHKHLGKGNRKPLPSCVVWYIRNYYPEDDGKYIGFKPAH